MTNAIPICMKNTKKVIKVKKLSMKQYDALIKAGYVVIFA